MTTDLIEQLRQLVNERDALRKQVAELQMRMESHNGDCDGVMFGSPARYTPMCKVRASQVAELTSERDAIEEQAVKNADEVLALREERDALQAWKVEHALRYLSNETQLEEAYKDACRYRWLRVHSTQPSESWSTHSNPESLDAVVDAAIDEAMKDQK